MTEAALLAAVAADPLDRAAREVLADYYLERGDPRGELIGVQCLLADEPGPWARVWLQRRAAELVAQIAPPAPAGRWCFDRGAQGLELQIDDVASLEAIRPRWLALRADAPLGLREQIRAVAELARAPAFAQVERLTLPAPVVLAGNTLLDAAARPRQLALSFYMDYVVEEAAPWFDAPIAAAVEHLTLDGELDDALGEALVASGVVGRLRSLTIDGRRLRSWAGMRLVEHGEGADLGFMSDASVAALVRAASPALRRLDLRGASVTRTGVELLAGSSLQLDELWLAADDLGPEGIAAVAGSRLAPITRLVVARATVPTPATYAALARTTMWRGALDLWSGDYGRPPRDPAARGTPVFDLAAVGAALADAEDAVPCPDIRLCGSGTSTSLPRLLRAPIGRGVRDLTLTGHRDVVHHLLDGPQRLRALRLVRTQEPGWQIARLFTSAVLAELETLWLVEAIAGPPNTVVPALARSPLRLRELRYQGAAPARTFAALLASEAMERLERLEVYLEHSFDARALGRALVESPQLARVERISLGNRTQLDAHWPAIEARFGSRLRPWR